MVRKSARSLSPEMLQRVSDDRISFTLATLRTQTDNCFLFVVAMFKKAAHHYVDFKDPILLQNHAGDAKIPSEYYFRFGSAILETDRHNVFQRLWSVMEPSQFNFHAGDAWMQTENYFSFVVAMF